MRVEYTITEYDADDNEVHREHGEDSATVTAPPEVRCGCGRWAAPGQHHWRLRHVLPLPEPVAARGRQDLWQPAPNVRPAVEQQLRAATCATPTCWLRLANGGAL